MLDHNRLALLKRTKYNAILKERQRSRDRYVALKQDPQKYQAHIEYMREYRRKNKERIKLLKQRYNQKKRTPTGSICPQDLHLK